jgi:D-cysteine desulfhydrase
VTIGRRAVLAGGLVVACSRNAPEAKVTANASDANADGSANANADADADGSANADASADADASTSTYALFDRYPALATKLPRVELGRFPSAIERARSLPTWIKRDDELAQAYGGGKVRKLELYFGDARALGKTRIVTFGGVGSNQALAAALLGKSLGFRVLLYLAPQPPSTLVSKNLRADAASDAEMRLFESVAAAQAEADREAKESKDLYVIPPGGTTPLGTLGFVSAGLELAADVRAAKMPAPKRIYVALGLGGTTAGLGIGCAAGGLRTEIVGVRASNPATVTEPTLRAIHSETIAFLRARDPSFPNVKLEDANVRIDGRFVGAGYGVPTSAGDDAVRRARTAEGWELEPVYTGKVLAALLDDARTGFAGPTLFWNTASSRAVALGDVPAPFRRFVR